MNSSRFLQYLFFILNFKNLFHVTLCFIRTLREFVVPHRTLKKSLKKNIVINVNYGHYIIFIFIYRSCRGVLIDMCEKTVITEINTFNIL